MLEIVLDFILAAVVYVIVPGLVTWAIEPTSVVKGAIIFLFVAWVLHKPSVTKVIQSSPQQSPKKDDGPRDDYEHSVRR